MQVASSLSSLESYLTLISMRERIVAANVANADTPGYRALDIDFSGELQKAMNASIGVDESQSNAARLAPAAYAVPGLLERPDGNNVSLDHEGILLAEIQLQHQIGVQLIKHHFHSLLSVINGGQS